MKKYSEEIWKYINGVSRSLFEWELKPIGMEMERAISNLLLEKE